MANLVHNEKTKLRATLYNNVAAAFLIFGLVRLSFVMKLPPQIAAENSNLSQFGILCIAAFSGGFWHFMALNSMNKLVDDDTTKEPPK